MGVNSTNFLIELHNRAIIPDAILFEDTGDENQVTYQYFPIISKWLKVVGFPPITVVWYQPAKRKNSPEYRSLSEECLTINLVSQGTNDQ
jgi:hypothetical protein